MIGEALTFEQARRYLFAALINVTNGEAPSEPLFVFFDFPEADERVIVRTAIGEEPLLTMACIVPAGLSCDSEYEDLLRGFMGNTPSPHWSLTSKMLH